MAHLKTETHEMLDVYIYDYLVKRKYSNSARIFHTEAGLSATSSAIDAPGGFLFEWWSVFWDVFISRYNQRGTNNEKFMQPRGSVNIGGQLTGATQSSVLRSATSAEQPSRQLLNCSAVGNLRHVDPVKFQMQQFLASQGLINPITNARASSSDGSFIGYTGSNQTVDGFPLEGRPLMLQPGLPQPLKPSPRPNQQYHLHPQVRMIPNEHGMLKSTPCHQQARQSMLLDQRLGSHNYKPREPEKLSITGNIPSDASLSNTSGVSNQEARNRTLGKRKQPISSTCPSNISGIADTTTMQLSLVPSDDMDYFVNNESLPENIESFSSSSDPETKSAATLCLDDHQDVTLSEIGTIYANTVSCCDLSSDGMLCATSGGDKKIVVWSMDSKLQNCLLEEHTNTITDLRFAPKLPWLATSSLDNTLKFWNVDNPSTPVRTFSGHTASVMSLDFHPKKLDLICSSDEDSSIRYWSIRNGDCTGVSKGGANMVRFQPVHGKYLAAAAQNSVSLIDVETARVCGRPLKGHTSDVLSISWDLSGEYLATLSEDLVRVWRIRSGGEEDCINELSITGKRFRCCVFHSCKPSALVIGSNQCLELWHMTSNKTIAMLGEPMNTLAQSRDAGLVASANDENIIKLWK